MDARYYDYNIGVTTDESLEIAEMEELDVVGQIVADILEDEENDSENLINLYINADETERAIMDSMLINICGYTVNHPA